MPKVDRPLMFDTPEADAILSALEVFPPDHPILSAPNTVLTPHLGYVTEENYRVYFQGAVEAVDAYLNGSPVRVLRAD